MTVRTRAFPRAAVLSVAVLALAVSGCAKPWLKQDTKAPEPKPSNALVTGFSVRFDSGSQDKSLLEAAADAAQNAQLADFGKKATDLFVAALAERGYTATFDQNRTRPLDAIQLASNSGAAALTGMWRHPDASHWTPDTVDNWMQKPGDVITKVKAADGKEYYAFAEIVIRDQGMFFKEPFMVVRASVYDQDAKKVLDLQGIGEGESHFFMADRSPANLETALKRGFESLKTVQAEQL